MGYMGILLSYIPNPIFYLLKGDYIQVWDSGLGYHAFLVQVVLPDGGAKEMKKVGAP